jgi:hypothetical protein
MLRRFLLMVMRNPKKGKKMARRERLRARRWKRQG